ncbi:MAG: PGPGW domain-containing protein [Thermodesulfobacteriota bacterium]|nr:PGPGW domain-containing protein [Thermodesulfobacteriota bacterium]
MASVIQILEWIEQKETLLWWLAGSSLGTFAGTLILVPWLIIHIPHDYFSHDKRRKASWTDQYPVIRAILVVGKNVLGGLLVAVGIIMLVLPGQGLLTIVLGLVLLDFPGKYRLQRWMVSRGPVLKAINRLRVHAGKPPITIISF